MKDDKPDYTLGDIFNEILIRGGSPKKTYSTKVPRPKIVRPEELTHLFIKQKEALSLLNSSIRDIRNYKNWNELEPEEITQIIEEDENYKSRQQQLFEDLLRAIRLGLIWHPWVSEFIFTYETLGNKELLRKINRRWETGVKRINRFMFYLYEIYEYRLSGKTWPWIRKNLMKKKIIKKITCTGLQKKFKKAWEARWARFNKKAPPIP
jgi:uncharacterized protein YfkK (UPF0435 family)